MEPETESEFVLSSSGRNYKKINRTPVSEIQCVQKCVSVMQMNIFIFSYIVISHPNSHMAVGYVWTGNVTYIGLSVMTKFMLMF